MKQNKYDVKTKITKGPLIFTLVGLSLSVLAIVLLAIFANQEVLGIAAIVFMSVIALAAIGVLFGILLDYAYVINDELTMVYIFKKKTVKIKDIKTMILKKGVYTVFDKEENKLGTINSMNVDADKLILLLERRGQIEIK